MSTYGVSITLEHAEILGLSGYEIFYNSSSISNNVFIPLSELTKNASLSTILLTKDIIPNSVYTFNIYAVYTDGTKSSPAVTTYTTQPITINQNEINLSFKKTIFGNIQLQWNSVSYLKIHKYYIHRYSNITNLNGTYILKNTYSTTNQALDIPDYFTNDYFKIAFVILVNGKEEVIGESSLVQANFQISEDICKLSIENSKLKIDINNEIIFTRGEVLLNNNIVNYITTNSSYIPLVYELKNYPPFPTIQVDVILYNSNEEVSLRFESEVELPSINPTNITIIATKSGISLKFSDFPITIKQYVIESAPINTQDYTEIYSGELPEFVDTRTYQGGVSYKVKVLDFFDRWSDYYIEHFPFKQPVPPINLQVKIDKLTKNISIFWDYEYPDDDYIEIKEFVIITNNGSYKTVDKSYVLPLTEDLSVIEVGAVDYFGQQSATVFLELNIPKPPDPTNLRAVQVGNLISLYWDFPYYEYLECFEVKVNGWDFVNVFKTITSTSVTFEVIQNGTVDFYVKAKSIIGDYSENFAKTTITIVPNFYTNNIYTYTSQSDNWESCSIVNLTTQGTLLVSNDIEKATATIFFPPITYNSICRSTNYFSVDLLAIKKLFYKWSDFSDDDSDDPFPSTYKWSDLRFEKWVVSSEKTEIGSWYILPVQNNINDSNFYQLENSLYNSTNTNKLSTTLGDQYVTFKPCFLTKGIQVTQDSTKKLNNILIPINYGISFNALVNFNNGSVLGKLTNGNQFCVIGVSNHIISLSGTYTNYIELSNIDFQHILTVKIKQNIINFIINNQLYSITLPFTPTTFIYGGF